jgi:hypothetical protein
MECATFFILIVYRLFAVSQHSHTNYCLGVRQLILGTLLYTTEMYLRNDMINGHYSATSM